MHTHVYTHPASGRMSKGCFMFACVCDCVHVGLSMCPHLYPCHFAGYSTFWHVYVVSRAEGTLGGCDSSAWHPPLSPPGLVSTSPSSGA